MIVADRIGVMDRGRLMQIAPPAEVYERPNSRWVADFVGEVNLFEGRIGADRLVVEGTAAGRIRLAAPAGAAPGATVWVAVRPEKLRIIGAAAAPDANPCITGSIVDIGYLGGSTIYHVRTADGAIVTAAVANSGPDDARAVAADDRIRLSFAPEAAVVLTR
jgi:putrescine transport system ATP-binding protein